MWPGSGREAGRDLKPYVINRAATGNWAGFDIKSDMLLLLDQVHTDAASGARTADNDAAHRCRHLRPCHVVLTTKVRPQ